NVKYVHCRIDFVGLRRFSEPDRVGNLVPSENTAVDIQAAMRHQMMVKLSVCSGPSPDRQTLAKGWLGKQAIGRAPQSLGVVDWNSQASLLVSANPGDAACMDGCIYHWATARHGFHLDKAEPFAAGIAGKPKCSCSLVGARVLFSAPVSEPNYPSGD